MARKDLGISKVEQLKGLKIANQTGSSIGNIFVDQIAPAAGLKKGDYQEVRMDVNNMVAAMAAKTVDAMVNVEPYNAIAEADGLATTIMDYWERRQDAGVHGRHAGVRRQERRRHRRLSQGLARRGARLQGAPQQRGRHHLRLLRLKGYSLSQDTFRKALATVDVDPGFPADLRPYMQQHAEVLLKEKKIAAIPDWGKALQARVHGQGALGDVRHLSLGQGADTIS